MIEFKDIPVVISASALVEDIQMLYEAIEKKDWGFVNTVRECLEDSLRNAKKIPGTDIVPSPTSVIAMGHSSGIMMNEDGSDLVCTGGIPVSELTFTACTRNCPHCDECNPEKLCFMLEGGFLYNGADSWDRDEALMEFVEENYAE